MMRILIIDDGVVSELDGNTSQEVEAIVRKARATMVPAPFKAVQQWRTAETKPEEGEEVLVFDGEDFVVGQVLWGGWVDTQEYLGIKATHWMPLPEPPKEES